VSPFGTPYPHAYVVKREESAAKGPKADARTRTEDPFITSAISPVTTRSSEWSEVASFQAVLRGCVARHVNARNRVCARSFALRLHWTRSWHRAAAFREAEADPQCFATTLSVLSLLRRRYES
jgi:hypothetical protein